MLNGLKREGQYFVHNFQNIMVLRELQESFGDIYLGGGGGSTDMFFILENITTNCQTDATEFEGMLYTMLSEEPFANHGLDMTNFNEEYIISDYVSHNIAITIGETWTCLTCKTPKSPKIFKDFAFFTFGTNVKEGEKYEKNQSREKDSFWKELCDNDRFDGQIL